MSHPEVHPLRMTLEEKYDRGDGDDLSHRTIRLTYKGAYDTEILDVSLRRTIRVPDNDKAYALPPDLGAFPIYSVDRYKGNLPESMVTKGGAFVPIHRESSGFAWPLLVLVTFFRINLRIMLDMFGSLHGDAKILP